MSDSTEDNSSSNCSEYVDSYEYDEEIFWKAVDIVVRDKEKKLVNEAIIDRFIETIDDNHNMFVDNDRRFIDMSDIIDSAEFVDQMNQNAAFRIAAKGISPYFFHTAYFNHGAQELINSIMTSTYLMLKSTNYSSICGFLEALIHIVQPFPVLEILINSKFADDTETANPNIKVKDLITLVHYFLNFKGSHNVVARARELFNTLIDVPFRREEWAENSSRKLIEKFLPKLKALVKLSIEEFSMNALLEIKSMSNSLIQINDLQELRSLVKIYSIDDLLVKNLDKFLAKQDLHIDDLVVYCQCLALTTIRTNKDDLVLHTLAHYKNITLKPIAAYFITKGYPKNSVEERNWSKYILYPVLSTTEHNDMIALLNLDTAERALADRLIDRSSILLILTEIARLDGKVCDLRMFKKIIDIMSCYITSNMNKITHHREVMQAIEVLHHMCRLHSILPKKTTQNELRYLVSIMTDLGEQMTNDLFLFQIFKGLRMFTESSGRLNHILSPEIRESRDRQPKALKFIFGVIEKRQFTSLLLKSLERALNLNDVSLLIETVDLLAVYIERTGFDAISDKLELSACIILKVWPFIHEINNSYLMAPCLSIMIAIDAEKVNLRRFGFTQFKHIPYLLTYYLCDMEKSCEVREKIITLLTAATSSSRFGYLTNILKQKNDSDIIDRILFGTCLSVRLGMTSACLKIADNIMGQIIEHFMHQNDFEKNVERLVKTNFITTLYEIFSSPNRSAYCNQKIFINSCNKIESFLAGAKQSKALSKALLKYWPKIVISDDETSICSTISRDIVFKEMNLNTDEDSTEFHMSNEPTVRVYESTSSEKKTLSILDICKNSSQLPEITVSKKTTIEDVLAWFTSEMKSDLRRLLTDRTDEDNEQWFKERTVIMDILACEEKKLDCPEMECH